MRLAVWLAATYLAVATAFAQSVVPTSPDKPDPSAKYLFYLHGRDVDQGGDRALQAYREVVKALSRRGFLVVSEARPKGSIQRLPQDLEAYARKVASDVGKLLEAGVPALNITVAGYSRGGVITLIASGLIGRTDLTFVVIAGCVSEAGAFREFVPTVSAEYAPKLKGRFLSLRDAADPDFGSCTGYFGKAAALQEQKEITLQTGKGHGAFTQPTGDWVQALVDWSSAAVKK